MAIGWNPERLDTIWGRRTPASKGPRPSLTADQIVTAAIELADTEGIDAVSMKRLGTQLGVGAMTIYTYIPDKSTLLEMMLDAAFGETDLPAPDTQWRTYLTQSAEAILGTYQRHPWALRVVVGGPPITPHQMRYVESTLTALGDTGLTDREMIDVTMALSYYVRGAAHLVMGIMASEQESGMAPEEISNVYNQSMERVLDPGMFPNTLRVLTGPPDDLEDEWDDFGFRFGLECLLEGVESLINTRQ